MFAEIAKYFSSIIDKLKVLVEIETFIWVYVVYL